MYALMVLTPLLLISDVAFGVPQGFVLGPLLPVMHLSAGGHNTSTMEWSFNYMQMVPRFIFLLICLHADCPQRSLAFTPVYRISPPTSFPGSFVFPQERVTDHSLLWDDERPWERGCTSSWMLLNKLKLNSDRT